MNTTSTNKMWVVFISSFPPRECGIATFTADLVEHFDEQFVSREETKVVAMNVEIPEGVVGAGVAAGATGTPSVTGVTVPIYSEKVIFQISENNIDEYIAVAKKLNDMSHGTSPFWAKPVK
jgi:hypothetical protein